MPDATLTIEAGAELEFYPSVGILVLGTLQAQGNAVNNIVMRPARLADVNRDGSRMGRRQNLHSDAIPSKYGVGAESFCTYNFYLKQFGSC